MRLSPRIRVAFDGVISRATHIKQIMPRRHPKRGNPAPEPQSAASAAADNPASSSYDRFKLLADCLPELVFYVDADEICKAHNNAVQDTLGVPAHDINERSVRDVLGEASYDCVKAYIARVLAGEEAKLRQVHRDRDGRLLGFDARYVPHRGANDAVLGFCVLLSPGPAGDPTWPLSGIAVSSAVENEHDGHAVDAETRRHAEDAVSDARDAQAREHALSQFRAALQGDRFRLFQQPIVPIGAGARVDPAPSAESYEVLLRLRNEEGRLIHPGAFLSRAEEIGFMRELDRWVVERAWRWLSDESRASQRPALRLHVNLSTDSVRDESFLRFVRSLVGTDRARADALCFEIAEATLLEQRMLALSCAHALRMLGCRTALDRFKGASGSFSVMLDMPVDFVKIDSSLVAGLVGDSHCATKVKIITTLARSMGASSIAERVEDADTRDALIRIGVDYVQGFGIAIPEALENL